MAPFFSENENIGDNFKNSSSQSIAFSRRLSRMVEDDLVSSLKALTTSGMLSVVKEMAALLVTRALSKGA